MTQARLGSVVGAVLAVIAGALFCNDYLGQVLIRWSYDLPFSLRTPVAPTNVVIVRMDEPSHDELKLPYHQPWDRHVHARLLERLTREGARTVIFDVLFSPQAGEDVATNATVDAATAHLASAMRAHGRVVLASHLRKEIEPGFGLRTSLEEPEEILRQAAAGVGLSEMQEDEDIIIRRLLPWLKGPSGARQPTLAWEAMRVEADAAAPADVPRRRDRWLNYYGPPGSIPSLSYYRALNEASPGYFSNQVVLIGPFYPIGVTGVRVDTFGSPFPQSESRFHGVELHATALLNLLQQAWLRRAPPWVEFGLVVLLGGVAGAGLPRFRPLLAAGVALGLILLVCLLGVQLPGAARLWFPWLIPALIQVPVAFVWAVLFHAIKGYVNSMVLERSLSHYLSPKQVTNILEHPELLHAGGVEERISILFSDLANFSRFSERMPARDLLELLNRYCDQAITCIHETDGTVIKIIGDSIFAVWNAPQPQPDHALRACRAALRLHACAAAFSNERGMPPLRTRIGLHTGRACVGNLGSRERFDYTAVGMEVNLASRLESLNKTLGTDILITRDALEPVKGEFASRWLGYFRLKGFDAVVEVHELLGARVAGAPAPAWQDRFAEGLHQFHRGKLDRAGELFAETLRLRPDDGPATFYSHHLREISAHPVPEDWTGDVHVNEK